jgi:AcrR family transcriptional regulator
VVDASHGPLRGRQSEARRNDDRILRAAREVFAEDGYGAPVSRIAQRAGVGVATLYGRYRSKDELAEQMVLAGMTDIIGEAQASLDQPDAWEGFARFMRRCTDAGAGALVRFARTVPSTDELQAMSGRVHDSLEALLNQTRQRGGLRPEVTAAEILVLLAALRIKHPSDPARTPQLRQRYLALLLAGLRATDATPLPGPPLTWTDIERGQAPAPQQR